ncbi:MAG: hypothetical protein ACRD2L_11025, partial [Terriglobia bacterium]
SKPGRESSRSLQPEQVVAAIAVWIRARAVLGRNDGEWKVAIWDFAIEPENVSCMIRLRLLQSKSSFSHREFELTLACLG